MNSDIKIPYKWSGKLVQERRGCNDKMFLLTTRMITPLCFPEVILITTMRVFLSGANQSFSAVSLEMKEIRALRYEWSPPLSLVILTHIFDPDFATGVPITR